jgi:hypothetical protein
MRDDRKVDISLHGSELYQVSIGGREIMNPIAVAMVVLGALLLGWGLLMLAKHRKAIGFTLSFLGSVMAVTPFVISFLLFR